MRVGPVQNAMGAALMGLQRADRRMAAAAHGIANAALPQADGEQAEDNAVPAVAAHDLTELMPQLLLARGESRANLAVARTASDIYREIADLGRSPGRPR